MKIIDIDLIESLIEISKPGCWIRSKGRFDKISPCNSYFNAMGQYMAKKSSDKYKGYYYYVPYVPTYTLTSASYITTSTTSNTGYYTVNSNKYCTSNMVEYASDN